MLSRSNKVTSDTVLDELEILPSEEPAPRPWLTRAVGGAQAGIRLAAALSRTPPGVGGLPGRPLPWSAAKWHGMGGEAGPRRHDPAGSQWACRLTGNAG